MKATSHTWKPLVYIGVTLGGVAVALGTLFLLVKLVHPGFSLVGLRKGEGRAVIAIACIVAYGTVVGITRLLKRRFGRVFGTYLDDPDAEDEAHVASSSNRPCRRCGTLFAVFRNDFHAAGFCSRACQEAFGRAGG